MYVQSAKIRFVSQRYFVLSIMDFVNYAFLCDFKENLQYFRKKM